MTASCRRPALQRASVEGSHLNGESDTAREEHIALVAPKCLPVVAAILTGWPVVAVASARDSGGERDGNEAGHLTAAGSPYQSDRLGNQAIYVIKADGTNEKRLTT